MTTYSEDELELQRLVAAEICDEIYGPYVNEVDDPNKWAACIDAAIRAIAFLKQYNAS